MDKEAGCEALPLSGCSKLQVPLRWDWMSEMIIKLSSNSQTNTSSAWDIHWHSVIRNKCRCNHLQSHCQNNENLSSSFITFETARFRSIFLHVELKCGVIKSWQAELLAIFRAHTKSFPWITFSVCTDRRELFRAIKCVITAYPVCPEENFFLTHRIKRKKTFTGTWQMTKYHCW